MRLLVSTAAALSLLAVASAGAQQSVTSGGSVGADPAFVPPTGAEATTTDVGTALGAGALPGVGMETTTTTERNASGGPGGLSGGVGEAGVAVPGLMSGAPNATTAPGGGIPIETTPGVPLNPPVE